MTAEEVITRLALQPHPTEGGFFRETYRAPQQVERQGAQRSLATAIYYLLTPGTVSALHRLPGDEIFHFYAGDPVRMLQLHQDGRVVQVDLGTDLSAGQVPQVVVPGGAWQGSYLLEGGRWALLGCTMAPGFDYADYEAGRREELLRLYPEVTESIIRLTPGLARASDRP